MGLSGISSPFELLSQIIRQIIYALLTRAPLKQGASPLPPFDLHVLGTPPAFVLSQDQTLQLITEKSLKETSKLKSTDKVKILNPQSQLQNAIRFSKTR